MVGILDAAKYAYSYGRVSALPRYLGKEIYEKMLESKTVDEVVATLLETNYGKQIEEAIKGGIDVREVEKAITKYYLKICSDVIATLPAGVREGSKSILMDEFDVANLKRIIRGISNNKKVDEIIAECIEGNIKENDLREIANSDLRSAIDKIKRFGYILTEESLFEAENQLDMLLLKKWIRESEQIGALKGIIRKQIDMLNLKALIRFKVLGIETDKFIRNMVIGMFIRLQEINEIASLPIMTENIEAVNDVIRKTPYGDTFKDAFEDYKKTRSLEKLEVMIESAFSEFIMSQEPLTLGYVIAYLRKMKLDARNIRIMLICKKYNIDSDEIRKLIVI